MGGRSRRLVVAAVVAVLLAPPLVWLLVVSVLDVRDARQDVDPAEQADVEPAMSHVRALTDVLAVERNWVTIDMLGLSDTVALGPGGGADSLQSTDDAIASLRADIDAHADDEVLARLTPVVDALAGLQETRSRAEATIAAAGGPAAATDASAVYTAYGGLIDAVHAAGDEIALTIDDPDVRAGARLQVVAGRQQILTEDIVRLVLLGLIGDGISSPEDLSALVATAETWDAGIAELESAPPPYDAVIDDLLPDVLVAELPVFVDQAVAEGTVDMAAFMDVIRDGTFAGLDDAIAERQADVVEEVVEEADDTGRDDEERAVLLAGIALIGLLVLAGVVIGLVVSARSGPTAGPAHHGAPGVRLPPPPPPPPVVSRRP